jgi:hypothetical protein
MIMTPEDEITLQKIRNAHFTRLPHIRARMFHRYFCYYRKLFLILPLPIENRALT